MQELSVYYYGSKTTDHWNIEDTFRIDRLYYVYSGLAYCDGVKLEPGNIYIIPSKLNRTWKIDHCFGHVFFNFSVFPSFHGDMIFSISAAQHPELHHFLTAARIIMESGTMSSNLAVNILRVVLQLCARIHTLFPQLSSRIQSIVTMLQASGTVMPIKELADAVHLEPHYLIRLFKQEMQITPYQYMNRLRLQRAFQRIHSGGSIKEAAFASGFQSVAAFSTAFKKHYGIPPSVIR